MPHEIGKPWPGKSEQNGRSPIYRRTAECKAALRQELRMDRLRLPFNVARLFTRIAEGIREGKSVSPDFDVAVKRHRLLDVIQKASDTGIRQIP